MKVPLSFVPNANLHNFRYRNQISHRHFFNYNRACHRGINFRVIRPLTGDDEKGEVGFKYIYIYKTTKDEYYFVNNNNIVILTKKDFS